MTFRFFHIRALMVFNFLMLIVSSSYAQQGIRFEKMDSWQAVLEKAKAENRYIFVDCYATWCGPCKKMDKDVYASQFVANSVNERFICLKLQVDRTKVDDAAIRSWYKDAKRLQDKYAIGILPTLLFFSPDGILVKQQGGALKDTAFVKFVENGVEDVKSYKAQVDSFRRGEYSNEQMLALHTKASSLKDNVVAVEVGNSYGRYLLGLPDSVLMTSKNLRQLAAMTKDTKSDNYFFFKKHSREIDIIYNKSKVTDKLFAERTQLEAVLQSAVVPELDNMNTEKDWDVLEKKVKEGYGRLGMLAVREARFWKHNINDENADCAKCRIAYAKAFMLYFEEVGELNKFNLINNVVWPVFQYVDDKHALATALKIMKPQAADNFETMDTYANLLYKMGKIKDAVSWETKAVENNKKYTDELSRRMAKKAEQNHQPFNPPNPDSIFQQTLDKMKRGIPTW